MTTDFEGVSIPDFIHYIYVPILILEKEPVFSLLNVLNIAWCNGTVLFSWRLIFTVTNDVPEFSRCTVTHGPFCFTYVILYSFLRIGYTNWYEALISTILSPFKASPFRWVIFIPNALWYYDIILYKTAKSKASVAHNHTNIWCHRTTNKWLYFSMWFIIQGK